MTSPLEDIIIKRNTSLVLPVKIFPGSGKTKIREIRNGELLINVNAPPEKGKANKELISFLAKKSGISRSYLDIVSGKLSRHKKIAFPETQKSGLYSLVNFE